MGRRRIGSLHTVDLGALGQFPAHAVAPSRIDVITYRIGSALVGLLFIASGYGKLDGFESVAARAADIGLPLAHVLLAFAITLEVVAGALLILGIKVRWAALALAAVLVPTTTLFDAFWTAEALQYRAQLTDFLKNLAILGGTLALASHAKHFSRRSASRR